MDMSDGLKVPMSGPGLGHQQPPRSAGAREPGRFRTGGFEFGVLSPRDWLGVQRWKQKLHMLRLLSHCEMIP